MRQVKIGAPGFILMDEMRRDMPGTLQRIAQLGYDGIELLGFFGQSAADIRTWCAQAGLEPYSCFISMADLLGEGIAPDNPVDQAVAMPGSTPEEKLAYVKEIGCQYVGLLLPDDVMDETVMARINRAVALIHQQGLQAQYHNHAKEYLNRCGEGYRMDYIMENSDPAMLFEPDLGWIEIGGGRCPDQLRRYAGRIRIVHLKDYYREAFDTSLPHVFRPTGYGVMDWATLLPLCEQVVQPLWYTADHDKAYDQDIYQELGMSLNFIRNALLYCE